MLEHRWTRWIPRLVAALMAGAIPALGSVANTLEDAPPHLLEIVMVADTGGTMQVFYDRGLGVSEADSVNAALAPSPEAHTYRLPFRSAATGCSASIPMAARAVTKYGVFAS